MTHADRMLLLETARIARGNAYAPYSHFHVGAAIMTHSGRIVRGANMENASYGGTLCAERTALGSACSEGLLKEPVRAIAVVGGLCGEPGSYVAPCGICRQVIREFADPETTEIIMASPSTDDAPYVVKTLSDLLPDSFGPESLGRKS